LVLPKVNRPVVILGTIIILIAVGVLATAYSLHLFNPAGKTGPECPSTPSSQSSSANFTLIMSNRGFNASRTYAAPCPVLNVGKGQIVRIHLENVDPVETHGFAVTHYLDSGVLLGPGQTKDVVFTAAQAGTFTVYCNVLCSIHLYMQNGRLNVT